MTQKRRNKQGALPDPSTLTPIVQQHDEEWYPNTLFCDEKDNLFLGYVNPKSDEEQVEDLKPVSVKSALNWFSEMSKYVEGYRHEMDRLCRIAANAIPDQQSLSTSRRSLFCLRRLFSTLQKAVRL